MSKLQIILEKYYVPLNLLISITKDVGEEQEKIAEKLDEYITDFGLEERK